MAHERKSAGRTLPASSSSADNQVPAIALVASDRDESVSAHGPRERLACLAASDITDVIAVLAIVPIEALTPALLQMVQQRVYELACGVLSALDGSEDTADVRCRLYPSEAPGATS